MLFLRTFCQVQAYGDEPGLLSYTVEFKQGNVDIFSSSLQKSFPLSSHMSAQVNLS